MVGPPKTDRFKGRGPTKRDPPVLQARGLGTGLTTRSHVTETATKKINTTGRDGLSELSKDTNMNDNSKSRKETADRKMEILSAKCNVRIMYETGKLAQATAEMRRYNLHILGISESKWTGSG